MFASFCRFFLVIGLVAGTVLAATPQTSASVLPFGKQGRLLPSVRAKIKGHNRLHRPVYRTYKAYKSY